MVLESKRDIFKIRSSISPELKEHTVKKGGVLAGSGALLLILSGTFVPLELMKIWGIPIFIVGFTLIGLGLYPYKRLSSLETHPHELHFDGTDLFFFNQSKPLFKIPVQSIEKIDYIKKDKIYGLGLKLKKPIVEKIKILQTKFRFDSFAARWMLQIEGYDLFFPYFSERSWKELEEYLS